MFQRLCYQFPKIGSFNVIKRKHNKTITNAGNTIVVSETVTHNSNNRTRQIVQNCGISQKRILYTNKFHPYCVSLRQKLDRF